MHSTEKNQKIFFADKLSLFARLGIGLLSVLFLSLVISRLAFPFDNGILEAFNWLPAQHILEGKNPYAFALVEPYSMTPYGALFYAFVAAGQKLFGFQLWWGRILTVLAFAFCLWAIFQITKKITGERQAACVALLIGLAMFPAQFWIGALRPDLIGFAFAAGALWLIFTRVEENRKTSVRLLAGIVLLSAAAFFTKQTFFFTVGIAFLRFLQLKKWREAILTVTAFAVLTAAGIFLLNYTSDGGYIWQHWTHAQRLTFTWEKVRNQFPVTLKMPVFSLALVFLLIFIFRKRKFLFPANRERLLGFFRSPQLLILFYFFISFGWAVVSSGRVGSNVNYYIESSLLLAIICGFVYAGFRRDALSKPALAMIVLFSLGGAFQLARLLYSEYFRWQARGYYSEILDRTGKTISPGDACVSVAVELVVWSGCRVQFDDFSEYENGWSPELREAFEREVKTGRYAAIVWYDDTLQTKFPNYRLVPMAQSAPQRSFPVYLYVPANAP